MSKRSYLLGDLEDTKLNVDEREQWLEAHREYNDYLPLPDKKSTLRMKTLENSWFNYERYRSSKKSQIEIDVEPLDSHEVLRSRVVSLQTGEHLMDKIKLAMEASAYIYNKCVQLTRLDKVPLGKLNEMFVTNGGSALSKSIRKKFSLIPYDIRERAVNDFKIAYKTQLQLVKEGKKEHFEMKFMKKKHRCIVIRARQLKQRKIEEEGEKDKYEVTFTFQDWKVKEVIAGPKGKPITVSTCCPMISTKPIPAIEHSVRIFLRNKRLHMAVPVSYYPEKKLKGKIVALDPGVRAFQTTYDSQGVSYVIGDDDIMRLDMMKERGYKARRGLKRVWDKKSRTYKETKLEKATKSMRRYSRRIENKIKNKVADLHKKLANFLCKSYDTIIIPPFEVKKMTKKKGRKINQATTRRMYIWSHYKFRSLLISKGEQTGTIVNVRSEHFTSMTCSRCLFVKRNLGSNKIYKCSNCNLEISRDINGARNILIKNC